MKQFNSHKALSFFLKTLKVGSRYDVSSLPVGFSFLLSRAVSGLSIFYIPDRLFEETLRFWGEDSTSNMFVFIPPKKNPSFDVPGFHSIYSVHKKRAQARLAGGLDGVTSIVCSSSSAELKIVGTSCEGLSLCSNLNYEDCLSFLNNNGFNSVDIVSQSGEYSLRGGLVDVFPFSSSFPVRINFLDDSVCINRFDVETQLSSGAIEKIFLPSCSSKGLRAVCEISSCYSFLYEKNLSFFSSPSFPLDVSSLFVFYDYKSYINNTIAGFRGLFVDNDLRGFCLLGFDKKLVIPSGFEGKSRSTPVSVAVSRFSKLTINKGDYVVHREHGVGVCDGVALFDSSSGEQEFLLIKYHDGGIVRLNSARLDLVDLYATAGSEGIVLDSLNKKGAWSKKLASAKKQAEDVVRTLLDLYVKRQRVGSGSLLLDNDLESRFIDSFPYVETEDQLSAWNEISKDMLSKTPMDRLLCGDVGFGKTELAIRASFCCAYSGKRTIVLAPTTILVNQLYSSFTERLSPFGVAVDMVSRFRSKKQTNCTKKHILNNKNDVLIGTHSVLNDEVFLKNIGLLVIDEEHRFGVSQKEQIKKFKEDVNVLSMSATPIPRSINLALSGLYSISLLQTPPLLRMPIITSIKYYNESFIVSAIQFEVSRGGQVYFLHNDVKSISRVSDRLSLLLPLISVVFVHGQETPRAIEKKMSLFVSGKIDVLVCTSIIEAGIDVSNANSLIINNSHLFGLSQLYQIRGRIGRGNRQAYAYLLVPRGGEISSVARKRLKSIISNSRLGSGYNIARSDLELRGGGSLFGYKQSGGGSVGYDLYMKLINKSLHQAVKIKNSFKIMPEDVSISIYKHKTIPVKYVPSQDLRLSFYKNFSSASSIKEIKNIVLNLVDRFGPLPLSVKNLQNEYVLRILSSRAGVFSLRSVGCGISIKLSSSKNEDFVGSLLDYFSTVLEKESIVFHVLPGENDALSFCVHILEKKDKFSILSMLLNKIIKLA